MSMTFQFRSTQLNAFFAKKQALSSPIQQTSLISAPSIKPITTEVGVFGGSYLDIAHGSGSAKGVQFAGYGNLSKAQALSILLRVIPRFSGAGGITHTLLSAVDGAGFQARNSILVFVNTTNHLAVQIYDAAGTQILSYVSTNPLSITQDQATDIMISWDGTTSANSFNVSQDGVVIDQMTATGSRTIVATEYTPNILLGTGPGQVLCNFDINEVVIWDDVENPVYAARSNFIAASAFDGSISTDPGEANVRVGVNYMINGEPLSGQIDLSEAAIQLDISSAVTLIAGSTSELLIQIMQKLFPSVPQDLTDVQEITVKLQNADGTIIALTLSSGAVRIVHVQAGQIAAKLTSVQSALLALGDGVQLTVTLQIDDGNVSIYDFSGQNLSVVAPTIS